MNREHIAQVRDALKVLAETGESPVEGIDAFDMADVSQPTGCGAACCLLGWSAHIEGEDPDEADFFDDMDRFDLRFHQLNALTLPSGKALATRNPAHGAAMLDWLLEQPDDVTPDAITAKWAEVVP